MWGVAYVVLLAALLVRVRTEDVPPPAPVHPLPGEPLWITRLHHALFTLLVIGAPVERLVLGGAARGRPVGLLLLAGGVVLYRLAGRTLGAALSPFIEPRDDAPLVTHGLYRHLRHPIYLSQAMIAVGAPLTLGCRWVLPLTLGAIAILAVRIAREEQALARTFPDYARYAATTKRLLPFVY
jgi:protein-S-isoprenylcysteine O-methyltransferase Ste14